jgi:hypothetical protein
MRPVRHCGVEDLAEADLVIQGTHKLLDRSEDVTGVHPIQVDMVGLQSTQARLDRADYLLAVVAGTVRITRVGLVCELGGEHEPVAAPFEQLAEDGFGRPVGVDVGGVDDVAASVSEQVQHRRADIWGRPPAPIFTEGHRAQRHLRDPHAGLTQNLVTHEIPSLLCLRRSLPPCEGRGLID